MKNKIDKKVEELYIYHVLTERSRVNSIRLIDYTYNKYKELIKVTRKYSLIVNRGIFYDRKFNFKRVGLNYCARSGGIIQCKNVTNNCNI